MTTTVAAGFRPRRGSSRSTSGFSAIARNSAASVHTNRSRMRESEVADEAEHEQPDDDLRHRSAGDVDRHATATGIGHAPSRGR